MKYSSLVLGVHESSTGAAVKCKLQNDWLMATVVWDKDYPCPDWDERRDAKRMKLDIPL